MYTDSVATEIHADSKSTVAPDEILLWARRGNLLRLFIVGSAKYADYHLWPLSWPIDPKINRLRQCRRVLLRQVSNHSDHRFSLYGANIHIHTPTHTHLSVYHTPTYIVTVIAISAPPYCAPSAWIISWQLVGILLIFFWYKKGSILVSSYYRLRLSASLLPDTKTAQNAPTHSHFLGTCLWHWPLTCWTQNHPVPGCLKIIISRRSYKYLHTHIQTITPISTTCASLRWYAHRLLQWALFGRSNYYYYYQHRSLEPAECRRAAHSVLSAAMFQSWSAEMPVSFSSWPIHIRRGLPGGLRHDDSGCVPSHSCTAKWNALCAGIFRHSRRTWPKKTPNKILHRRFDIPQIYLPTNAPVDNVERADPAGRVLGAVEVFDELRIENSDTAERHGDEAVLQ